MISEKGVSFVVALGQELWANCASGSASAQLSCCRLLQCLRYCSSVTSQTVLLNFSD